MTLTEMTRYELTVPAKALVAADRLVAALAALNEADGSYAIQQDGYPYGEAYRALKATLAYLLDDNDRIIDEVYRGTLDGCNVTEALANLSIEVVKL